jgi:hypothetical protein
MINRYLVVADDLMVCVVVFFENAMFIIYPRTFFLPKKNIIIGLYVENLPQRGSCSCCSKRNSSANPDLSCYRRVICSFIVYHFDVPKVQFFIKNSTFNCVFANI